MKKYLLKADKLMQYYIYYVIETEFPNGQILLKRVWEGKEPWYHLVSSKHVFKRDFEEVKEKVVIERWVVLTKNPDEGPLMYGPFLTQEIAERTVKSWNTEILEMISIKREVEV